MTVYQMPSPFDKNKTIVFANFPKIGLCFIVLSDDVIFTYGGDLVAYLGRHKVSEVLDDDACDFATKKNRDKFMSIPEDNWSAFGESSHRFTDELTTKMHEEFIGDI